MPPQLRLHYSIKANPMPALVQHMATLVDGFDVASGGELSIALDTPLPAVSISFTGPGKSEAELSRAISAGVVIHLESERELEAVNALANRLGIAPRVMVRVNPDFALKSSGMKMGGAAHQFGVDAEQVPALLARIVAMDIEFEGFHVYSGSQNLRADAIIEEKRSIFALAAKLAQEARMPVRRLNIGGGFGIPYFPGEMPLDIRTVGEKLASVLHDLPEVLTEVETVLELGRYLVAEAGVYIAKVIDRKQSRGETFLVTDGGMHHHLAASGNLGQVLRKNYPVVLGSRVLGESQDRVTVSGPLCTPLDVLAERILLTSAIPGDLVAVFQSGAYGLTASPSAFLGHTAPAEVLI